MYSLLDIKIKVYRLRKGKVVEEEMSLPTYTAADEGKVLGIVEGQLGWVAASGGPIAYVESLDNDNLLNLRDLESGSYVVKGRFRPFEGADSTMNFSSSLIFNVIKSQAKSSIQIFYPTNNCVQFLEITDSDYTRTNVYLNDIAAKVTAHEEAIAALQAANA